MTSVSLAAVDARTTGSSGICSQSAPRKRGDLYLPCSAPIGCKAGQMMAKEQIPEEPWDGSAWSEVNDVWWLAFDEDRAQTDIYLPFETLSISAPSSQELSLVALASEEEALKLWATMPSHNNLSSASVIGEAASNDIELFTLLNAFTWQSLASDSCPSSGLYNGANVEAAITGSLLHTFRGESATGTWTLELCDQ